MFDIHEELKKLPAKPGVYLMHDREDKIIYVGKAIRLCNRVRQYFQNNRSHSPKIRQMVSCVSRFEYIVTDSEVEALVLENNLIKEYRPKYNTMLTDDKTYPFIKVTVEEDFPRFFIVRQVRRDKAKYFGPYPDAAACHDAIDLVHKIYQIRSCSRVLPRDIGRERACLNYHIHQCTAPCEGRISKEAYHEHVREALAFINGDYARAESYLEKRMQEASERLEFEQAAGFRDTLLRVRTLKNRQKITDANETEDRDVIAFARNKDTAIVQVFFIRSGKLLGREHYYLSGVEEETDRDVLTSFVKQYYSGTPEVPRELLLQYEPEDPEVIREWLAKKRGGAVQLLVPKIGQKEKMVELAQKNAEMVLAKDAERIASERKKTIGALEKLAGLLGLPGLVRLESFDISNTSGCESVGSMVVFEEGRPQKSDYRKFRIRTVQGPNDYASMQEVLTRRFRHGLDERQQLEEAGGDESLGSFTRFPDLILMDGGRGQVGIALEVLHGFGLTIPVCGMVKDDSHRTRGIWFEGREIPIDVNSEAFKLVTRIQDETHRFAIEYHRNLRSKTEVHSVLEDIDGIGPARRRALMRQFGSIEEIRNAEQEKLAAVPSMNAAAAEQVWKFFHHEEAEEKPIV